MLYRYRHHLVLFLIVAALFIANYKPGTFLTGWDNLQTDLNPWLGVRRAFFAVWQEYQSFGLLGGMAHASDLVRSIAVWIMSFVLPQSLIRYVFHFLMLYTGGIGMMTLLKEISFITPARRPHHSMATSQVLPQSVSNTFGCKSPSTFFLGAVFYMLNFATLQMFYLPFEPFSVFFAMLPWEIWIFVKTVRDPLSFKKHLPLFFLINLLATPQAYVQTLFVVYMLVLGCFAIGSSIKRSFLLFLIIIAVNSFWILPQTYFLATKTNVVKDAKINQLATEDTYYQNREKGALPYFLKMEGFYTELYDTNNQPLFLPWKNHLKNPIIQFISYIVIAVILVGFLYKHPYRAHFIGLFLLVALALLSAVPPFSWIQTLLRKNAVIDQIFRSPFTKFAIPYSLTASYFFASGTTYIAEKLKNPRAMRYTLYAILFFIALPSFQGFFISPVMKTPIPHEYLQAIDYFKYQNKKSRIALLPEYTFWGWFLHRWGYNGSGFLWYGIEQPIVSRTFDVWSKTSESYFWEMKYAIDSENHAQFENILEKYNIDYLLLDYSLLPVTSTIKGMQYDKLDSFISRTSKIFLVKKWGNLSLYKVNHFGKRVENFTAVSALPDIKTLSSFTPYDSAYAALGDYQRSPGAQPDRVYPFAHLMTQKILPDVNITENTDSFLVRQTLPPVSASYTFSGPDAFSYSADLTENEKPVTHTTPVKTDIDNLTLKTTIKKERVLKFDLSKTELFNCSVRVECFGYEETFLEQRYGYLVKVANKNIQGRRPFFYIQDLTKQQTFLETRLTKDIEYFILPPLYFYGRGYYFGFHNVSYENLASINSVQALEVYLFPIEKIRDLHFEKAGAGAQKSGNTLILYQEYDEGWKAYSVKRETYNVKRIINQLFPFVFGTELKEHVLVNNWTNGWKTTCNAERVTCNVVTIFLPQYLEYIGFFILGLTLACITKYRKHNV